MVEAAMSRNAWKVVRTVGAAAAVVAAARLTLHLFEKQLSIPFSLSELPLE
jgi:hypothetical protein